MVQQDDRRRTPMYWFQHERLGYVPVPFPQLAGVHPFCFFRSREYAREFLYHWVPAEGIERPWTSQSVSRNDWSIDGDETQTDCSQCATKRRKKATRIFLSTRP